MKRDRERRVEWVEREEREGHAKGEACGLVER
jgi:hypothetical protein